MQDARAVLAEFHELLAQRKPAQVSVAAEGRRGLPRMSLAERWLRQEYTEGYGGLSEFPLPKRLEGSSLLLALRLSAKYMPEGLREAAWELLGDPSFRTAVAASLVLYGIAWAAPEPLFTKAFAASVTLALTLVFTVAELVHFGTVCMRFYQDVQRARTEADLEVAAERFGRYLGGAGLRILAYLGGRGLARALPHRPPGGGLRKLLEQRRALPSLPGGKQVNWGTATAVQASAAEGTVVVAGVAASATAQGFRSACKDGSLKLLLHSWHHLATSRNPTDTARGGPWTPRFQQLFAMAGMSLDASENLVYLERHAGPHPEAYHVEVFERLKSALERCGPMPQCRARLIAELRKLADEVCTPGSKLHRLATRP